MDKRKIRKSISALEKERKLILEKVLYPGRMISGGFVERWLKCGKANCRCQQGELHGPYYYLSVLEQGKPRMIYLGRGEEIEVKLLRRYQQFQQGIARLNVINREIVQLLWELAEDKIEVFKIKKG